MTFRFVGVLRYRFRVSLFGHDLFVGPWRSQGVDVSAPVPAESASFALVDGFSAAMNEAAGGVKLSLTWEGMQIFSDTVPVAGSLPVSLQPLKGVVLSGAASLSA